MARGKLVMLSSVDLHTTNESAGFCDVKKKKKKWTKINPMNYFSIINVIEQQNSSGKTNRSILGQKERKNLEYFVCKTLVYWAMWLCAELTIHIQRFSYTCWVILDRTSFQNWWKDKTKTYQGGSQETCHIMYVTAISHIFHMSGLWIWWEQCRTFWA